MKQERLCLIFEASLSRGNRKRVYPFILMLRVSVLTADKTSADSFNFEERMHLQPTELADRGAQWTTGGVRNVSSVAAP